MLPGLYRPPFYSNNEISFHLENAFSHYSTINENITLIEDLNMIPDENKFLNCLNEAFSLKNVPNKPKCLNSQNPSMIDLVLTNQFTLLWFSLL